MAGTNEESWIGLWHQYRTIIVVACAAAVLGSQIYVHLLENDSTTPNKRAGSNDASNTKATPTIADDKPKANGPKRIKGKLAKQLDDRDVVDTSLPVKVLVFFSSITTKTETIAKEYLPKLAAAQSILAKEAGCEFLEPELCDLTEVEFEDYFVSPPKTDVPARYFYLFLLPSYNIDSINDTLLQHLQETHYDFRIDTTSLAGLLGYSVFGFGDTEGWPTEAEGFCFQAKELDKWMAKLTGRKRAYPVGMGDMKGDFAARLEEWSKGVHEVLGHAARTGSLGEGAPGSGAPVESDDEDVEEDDGEVLLEDEDGVSVPLSKKSGDLGDVEDLGKLISSGAEDVRTTDRKAPIAVDFTNYGSKTKQPKRKALPAAPKEMVAKDSPTYAALTKQGYAIVGSHSGVKICRWTKSALRGRGSCYKYSLYGINSHRCMEATPSLSCSNKCVFCWRHGTNPVGTTWRWVVDPPDMIFEGIKANHYQKIKMLRGMPGVRAERYSEAMQIRHCALSLVGEPIFYPHINELLGMLHKERISSFLVCNAQHPDQLETLKAVTQLYVSIDASNRDSLKKIDRPLHRDFWERFQRCLDILREKRFRHRTVYRLTLVKGFNVEDEAEGYAQLVERGLPCFIEVKGVTFCGTSTSSNAGLRMTNVPWYWEVCDFVRALEKRLKAKGLKYGIAAEHAHSCCILLGSERFLVDGKWHTHIDYQRFFELLEERGPDGDWTPEDYMGPPTPEWALWGNGGFDPRDDRVDRKGRKIEVEVIRERPADYDDSQTAVCST
ncbi:hypothetical protein CC79DRAFT_1367111 [Sarocladium strictum]